MSPNTRHLYNAQSKRKGAQGSGERQASETHAKKQQKDHTDTQAVHSLESCLVVETNKPNSCVAAKLPAPDGEQSSQGRTAFEVSRLRGGGRQSRTLQEPRASTPERATRFTQPFPNLLRQLADRLVKQRVQPHWNPRSDKHFNS